MRRRRLNICNAVDRRQDREPFSRGNEKIPVTLRCNLELILWHLNGRSKSLTYRWRTFPGLPVEARENHISGRTHDFLKSAKRYCGDMARRSEGVHAGCDSFCVRATEPRSIVVCRERLCTPAASATRFSPTRLHHRGIAGLRSRSSPSPSFCSRSPFPMPACRSRRCLHSSRAINPRWRSMI